MNDFQAYVATQPNVVWVEKMQFDQLALHIPDFDREANHFKKSIMWRNKEIVITAASSRDLQWRILWAHRIVDVSENTAPVEPDPTDLYHGEVCTVGKRTVMLLEKITIVRSEESIQQLSIF